LNGGSRDSTSLEGGRFFDGINGLGGKKTERLARNEISREQEGVPKLKLGNEE
jgi:hypothetical protein